MFASSLRTLSKKRVFGVSSVRTTVELEFETRGLHIPLCKENKLCVKHLETTPSVSFDFVSRLFINVLTFFKFLIGYNLFLVFKSTLLYRCYIDLYSTPFWQETPTLTWSKDLSSTHSFTSFSCNFLSVPVLSTSFYFTPVFTGVK